MGVPCRRVVSIGALTLHLLAVVTMTPFRAAAKMISELRAVAAVIAKLHSDTRGWRPALGVGCVF